MIYDLFLRNREFFPEAVNRAVNSARLFSLPAYPREFLTSKFTEQQVAQANAEFVLPFPAIALEDKVSCVILKDVKKEARGLGAERMFFEVLPLRYDSNPLAYQEDEEARMGELQEIVKKYPEGTFLLSTGSVGGELEWRGDDKAGWEMMCSLDVSACIYVDGKGQYSDWTRLGTVPGELEGVIRNAKTALEEVLYFNTPDRFVLERSPVRRRGSKVGRGKTSFDRPVYTLIDPKEARALMRLPEPTPRIEGGRVISERRAHWRAEHTRTLTSERYVDARGKVVTVPRTYVHAVWNGAREATVGAHHYKVICD